jgi:hypothetical protein
MNERIQELAYQAEDYADIMVDGGSEFHPVFVKKFAELIVQECMNVLHDNELWNRHISHALKEHFGVEE